MSPYSHRAREHHRRRAVAPLQPKECLCSNPSKLQYDGVKDKLMPFHTIPSGDYQMLASFRFALRGFLSFSDAAARAAGLTPRQHQALLGIKGASVPGTTSVSDIAAYLRLHHNSTVELVNRLAALGLVERELDSADRRRVLVRLTAAGERTLAELSTFHMAELERIRPELQSLLDRVSSHADL